MTLDQVWRSSGLAVAIALLAPAFAAVVADLALRRRLGAGRRANDR